MIHSLEFMRVLFSDGKLISVDTRMNYVEPTAVEILEEAEKLNVQGYREDEYWAGIL